MFSSINNAFTKNPAAATMATCLVSNGVIWVTTKATNKIAQETTDKSNLSNTFNSALSNSVSTVNNSMTMLDGRISKIEDKTSSIEKEVFKQSVEQKRQSQMLEELCTKNGISIPKTGL